MTTDINLIPGRKILFGSVGRIKGEEGKLTFPPLNFKAVKAFTKKIEELSQMRGSMSEEQIDSAVDMVRTALARNYPDITDDEVADGLDMGNVKEVLGAILGRPDATSGEAPTAVA